MASYRGHLLFSTNLATAYAGAAFWFGGFDWATALLGGGVTALSGMLPDLDSDSGVPVRTSFKIASAVIPLLMLRRLIFMGFTPGAMIATMIGTYLFIRYVVQWLFKRMTVHRGMFHSIPAMFIAGLGVFLLYHAPNLLDRYFVAAGTMIGFLSHLVLDEMCSVNIDGARVRLNRFAGTALKLTSPSVPATLATYAWLIGLAYLAAPQFQAVQPPWQHLVTAEAGRNGDATTLVRPSAVARQPEK